MMQGKHFYHPNIGYFEALVAVEEGEDHKFPEGTFAVPARPSPDYKWENGAWVKKDPTPAEIEAIRKRMPKKSMVEFRAILRRTKTPLYPEGIYASDIQAMINAIVDRDLMEEASDYFNMGQFTERINPWVDVFGNLAGLTPVEIDALWVAG